MKKIDCTNAERLIVTEVDEGLDATARASLEEHLRTCPECRQARHETAGIMRLVAADVPPEPDPEFWKYYDISLSARLREARPRTWWNWWWKPAAAAAVALAAFAVVHLSATNAPLTSPTTDEGKASRLAQVLEQVYGPVEDEKVNYAVGDWDKNSLTALKVYYADDEVVLWFEVEDANSLFL